ncbi:MAG: hypothetical protein ACYC6C_13580, partial [Coriobacteriia bacterium]
HVRANPGQVQETDETEADWRNRVWAEWITRLQVDLPSLGQQLQEIDVRFSVLEPSCSATTGAGRVLAPLAPALELPAWGLSADESAWPQYSTDLKVYVLFAQGYAGEPSASDQRLIARAQKLLRRSLSSWVDFEVITQLGFIVGSSPLGWHGVIGS